LFQNNIGSTTRRGAWLSILALAPLSPIQITFFDGSCIHNNDVSNLLAGTDGVAPGLFGNLCRLSI
jgi:hypothetical protein